jgi:hypothetical protein
LPLEPLPQTGMMVLRCNTMLLLNTEGMDNDPTVTACSEKKVKKEMNKNTQTGFFKEPIILVNNIVIKKNLIYWVCKSMSLI